MLSFTRFIAVAAALAASLPAITAVPTPITSTVLTNDESALHSDDKRTFFPFYECYEEKLLIGPNICKCLPYLGQPWKKRDVSEIVKQGKEKRTIWIDDKCIVKASERPDLLNWNSGCCTRACNSWCGESCLMDDEVCVSGVPTKPSSGHHGWWKRDVGCPAESEKCYVGGSASSPLYECTNTKSDIENCGGCSTVDPASPFALASNSSTGVFDCTAIPNAANVGCSAGRCVVQTCDPGYVVDSNPNGDRCVKSTFETIRLQKYRLQ